MMRAILAVLSAFSVTAHAYGGELLEATVAFDQAALRVAGKPAAELARWTRPIRLSIDGRFSPATARFVREAAASLVAETGQPLELVDRGDLVVRPGHRCITSLQWGDDGAIRQAIVEIAAPRPEHLVRCVHHEILHALGLRSHPDTPDSVLSYHPLAAGQATRLDRLLLRTLYDPRLSPSSPITDASRTAGAVLADALRARGRAP